MRLFLIGPGGVGKTTCGKVLAKKLKYKFIDLDQEFCQRIYNINKLIKQKGLEDYWTKNDKLFSDLTKENKDNYVFAVSSGFLVHNRNNHPLNQKHRKLLKKLGITILLLPSKSISKSTEIVVNRQLKRGLGYDKNREKEKFMKRYKQYQKLSNIKIFSYNKPSHIVNKILKELQKNAKKLNF